MRRARAERAPRGAGGCWGADILEESWPKSEKNVTIAEDVLALLKQRAEAAGLSLDEAATEAARFGLEEGRWRRLITVGRKYGRESGYTDADLESVIQSFRDETRGR